MNTSNPEPIQEPAVAQPETAQPEPAAEAEAAEAQAPPQPDEEPQADKAPAKGKKEAAREAASKAKAELEGCKARLAAAEQKAQELKDQFMRTAAEYDNFRKRSAREADRKFNDGVCFAVTQILSILDTLEMAANTACSDENYKKGVLMTLDKAAQALQKLNITEIEALGQPFDPNLMNAVQQVPAADGQKSGDVVQVFQKGYRIGGQIVRHAAVVVAE